MLALSLAVVVAAAVVMAGTWIWQPRRRDEEIERFHRARQMTTEWARDGVTRPIFADDYDDPDRASEESRVSQEPAA